MAATGASTGTVTTAIATSICTVSVATKGNSVLRILRGRDVEAQRIGVGETVGGMQVKRDLEDFVVGAEVAARDQQRRRAWLHAQALRIGRSDRNGADLLFHLDN